MTRLRLMIASPERELYHGDVDMVLAPGIDGQLGILPNHSSLIAQLDEGVLTVRVAAEEYFFAIHGGFLQVLQNRVTVLADTAERAEDIDMQRAEEARERALDTLRKAPPEEQRLSEVALRRSLVRLGVAKRRRRSAPGPKRPETTMTD